MKVVRRCFLLCRLCLKVKPLHRQVRERSILSLAKHSAFNSSFSSKLITSPSESRTFPSSSSRLSLSSSSLLSSLSSSPFLFLDRFLWSTFFLTGQSRTVSHSVWETASNLAESLKELTDDELSDRLDHLEKINLKLRNALQRRRPTFRPGDDAGRRPYVVDEASAQTVALLVRSGKLSQLALLTVVIPLPFISFSFGIITPLRCFFFCLVIN